MNRADETLLDVGQGTLQTFALLSFCLTKGLFQVNLEPAAKFCSRFASKCDGSEGMDIFTFAGPQQGDHAADHARGLAGAGCSFNEHILIQLI